MASKDPDYDAMAETADEPMGALALGDEEDGDGAGLDEEFLMHAKDAGLTEAQAKSMRLAIERCVELRDQGDYGADEPDADDMPDDEAAE